MPRHVDHDDRRQEIVNTAVRILAEQGLAGLSIRKIAAEMGGSVTLVTHYYPNRESLIDHLTQDIMSGWQEALDDLDKQAQSPRDRLKRFLEWCLPIHEHGLMEERARFQLLADVSGPSAMVLAPFDAHMRGLISERLKGLVPTKDLARTVDLLRVVTVGITTCTLEHSTDWPARRQRRVLDHALGLMSLA